MMAIYFLGRTVTVAKSIQQWIQEGEELYAQSMQEYQSLQSELEQLEAKLAEKQEEVNRMAQIIGKPPVESSKRLTAELVTDRGPSGMPNSPATIARALTGRGLGR
jgi:hypothetical protein